MKTVDVSKEKRVWGGHIFDETAAMNEFCIYVVLKEQRGIGHWACLCCLGDAHFFDPDLLEALLRSPLLREMSLSRGPGTGKSASPLMCDSSVTLLLCAAVLLACKMSGSSTLALTRSFASPWSEFCNCS